MDGHDPHALGVLLHYRRLGAGRPLGLLVQLLDEAAEGAAAGQLVAAGEVAHPLRVAQDLVAGRPQRHGRLGPGPGQHLLHRSDDRAVVPATVEFGEEVQHVDQRSELRRRLAVVATSAPRRPERMPAAVARLEAKQRLVVEREQAAAQRRVDGEVVVRPFHRLERRPQRLHLFPFVEGAGAQQKMGNAQRLQPSHVLTGRIAVPAQKAAEEEADVPRPDRRAYALAGAFGVRHLDLEAAVLDQPAHELDGGVGLARLDLHVAQVAATIGPGRRQRDHRGLARDRRAMLAQGDVVRATRVVVTGHQRGEGRVDQPLDRRHRAEARRQVEDPDAALGEQVLHVVVEHDVGTPEAVDRLLRIPDNEELARSRPHPPPVVLVRVVSREQQQDLRLERIRVLELVDEQVAVAPLQVGAHRGVRPQQVAGLDQQIVKVQLAESALRLFVALDRAGELVAEQRHQVRVGRLHELLQALRQPLPEFPDLLPGDALREPAAALAGRAEPAQATPQLDEPRLQLILNRLAAFRFRTAADRSRAAQLPRAGDPRRQFDDPVETPPQDVAAPPVPQEVGEALHPRREIGDLRLAVELRPPPARREVAPLHQAPGGVA